MVSNQKSVAVGCAVGIPCGLAFLVAFTFYIRARKKFRAEDLEYEQKKEFNDLNQDLSYNNIDQLKLDEEIHSEDSDQAQREHYERGNIKKQKSVNRSNSRYVPAYKQKFQNSVSTLNASTNSSTSNIPTAIQPSHQQSTKHYHTGSTSSLNTTNTNFTEFYNNVIPVIDNNNKDASSGHNSLDLARSLQQPTPSYTRSKPSYNRTTSDSTTNTDIDDSYELKNNYNVENVHEIQEEDQYENEFSNYSESKRAYIDSLRPKA